MYAETRGGALAFGSPSAKAFCEKENIAIAAAVAKKGIHVAIGMGSMSVREERRKEGKHIGNTTVVEMILRQKTMGKRINQ